MEDENVYSFIMGTFRDYYADSYVKARTIREAIMFSGYDLGTEPDVVMCADLGIDCEFPEEEKAREAVIESLETYREVVEALRDSKTVVTHFGDDLDNKSSIEALRRLAVRIGALEDGEELKVERVPAGQVKEGYLNVDTGGHRGNRSDEGTKTLVIDGDIKGGIKSAAQSLYELGIYVPEQIREFADARPTHVSALDSRSGLALVRYLSGKQAFELAEAHLLDKTLNDEQLEMYGLTEAHLKQQQIIDSAVEKINKYTVELPNGEKIVLAPEQIVAGSIVAYEMGIPYYASVNQHIDRNGNPDGVTFAISCKSGMKLPEEILKYGRDLVEQYRIDERTSGVFVNPNEQLIVAGGHKNPDFRIEGHTPESMLEELRIILTQTREKSYEQRIAMLASERVEARETEKKAGELEKEYNRQLKDKNMDFEEI